jgi:hypothetical protein
VKTSRQQGQSLVEYLLILSGSVLAAWAGLRIFHDALKGWWDFACLFIRLPNP